MFAVVAACVCVRARVCVEGVRQHYYLYWMLSTCIYVCIPNCAVHEHTHTHTGVCVSCFATQIITQTHLHTKTETQVTAFTPFSDGMHVECLRIIVTYLVLGNLY